MKAMGAERVPYFTKMGRNVEGHSSVADVIVATGMNWEVEKQPLFLDGGVEIPGRFATVRTDNNRVLGIVGDRYEVVQNQEGFQFIDDCLGEGLTFKKAGMYNKDERLFLVGTAPSIDIAGDEVIPHILFTNSHDGSGTVRATFTPMRLVCSNGLMLPAEGFAKGIVTVRVPHTKNVKDRLMMAKEVVMENVKYLNSLRSDAERFLATPFSDEQFVQLSKELTGIADAEAEEKATRGQLEMIEDLNSAYNEEDVQRFRGTAWGALLSVSDYDTHRQNSRNTGNEEYSFERIAYGMTVLTAAYHAVARMTGLRGRR